MIHREYLHLEVSIFLSIDVSVSIDVDSCRQKFLSMKLILSCIPKMYNLLVADIIFSWDSILCCNNSQTPLEKPSHGTST